MARRRTIVSIGEALLAEFPDRTEPAGLAIDIARAAAKLGHRGIPISRLGQDNLANELLTQLTALGVEVTHLQSDPDLPTGRLLVRSIAGVRKETLEQRAAFDNLQWDFDLVDVAHEADAVVFGMLGQRGGQSSSIITRFLDECRNALRLCDLTNRAPLVTAGFGASSTGEVFERGRARRSLELANVAVMDTVAWGVLMRGSRDAPHDEASRSLLRGFDIAAIVWAEPDQPFEIHTADGSFTAKRAIEQRLISMAITGLLHAFLRGEEPAKALETTERIVAHVREKPDEEVPDAMRA